MFNAGYRASTPRAIRELSVEHLTAGNRGFPAMWILVRVLTAGKRRAEFAICKHLPKVYLIDRVGVVKRDQLPNKSGLSCHKR